MGVHVCGLRIIITMDIMRSQGGVRMNAAKSFSRARKDEEQEMGVLVSATILALCCNRCLQRFVHDLNQGC